jgi:hypothetical protein
MSQSSSTIVGNDDGDDYGYDSQPSSQTTDAVIANVLGNLTNDALFRTIAQVYVLLSFAPSQKIFINFAVIPRPLI